MKLNINLVSHPIIQSLSSIAVNKSFPPNIMHQILKQLALLIGYEILRNWIKIYRITIQQTQAIKTISMIDPKESYVFISNEITWLTFFQDMQLILPDCKLQLIQHQDITGANIAFTKCKEIKAHSKIIIINHNLDAEYILKILHRFVTQYQMNIDQIRIACITCKINQLVKISNQHSKLHIYTGKIFRH